MSERIKKLATWMQWEWIDPLHIKNKNGGYVFDGREWNPLENIQDAWMLVERAEKGEVLFCIDRKGTSFETLKWCAEFRETALSSKFRNFSIEADTAPAAICAAIEKLMEGESK